MNSIDLGTDLGGLVLDSPLIAASGVWPMSPALWPQDTLPGLGAVCSKGLTLEPRAGNRGIRLWETPCGLLNSIGLQNKGLSHFIREELSLLLEPGLPLVVNLAPESPTEIDRMFGLLEPRSPDLAAVELNLSCPNVDKGGMAWGRTAQGVASATERARRAWPGRLWIKLTPQAEDLGETARAAQDKGADAVVAANTWLGLALDLENRRPVFDRTVAGLSGPAIFPLALRLVWEAAGAVNIPVLASGGVCSWEDAAAMILAGASAVELGTGLMADLSLPGKIAQGLKEYMNRQGFGSLKEMRGAARPSKGA